MRWMTEVSDEWTLYFWPILPSSRYIPCQIKWIQLLNNIVLNPQTWQNVQENPHLRHCTGHTANSSHCRLIKYGLSSVCHPYGNIIFLEICTRLSWNTIFDNRYMMTYRALGRRGCCGMYCFTLYTFTCKYLEEMWCKI